MKLLKVSVRFKSSAPVFLFGFLFILGFFISQHVGTFVDEGLERRTGIIALNEYVRLISPNFADKIASQSHLPRIYDHPDKYYGVVLQYPMLMIERLTGMDDSAISWRFRHAFCFFIFFTGLFFFYLFLKNEKLPEIVSLATIVFVFLSPRFLFESTYNIKDIGFLSTVFFSFYAGERYYTRRSTFDAFLFAFATALSCGVRLIGGFVSFFFFLADLIKRIEKKTIGARCFKLISIFVISTIVLLYAMYPGSWFDPLLFFPKAFSYMSHHPWSGDVLYMGSLHSSRNLPWHYLMVWIFITLPEFLLVFAAFGSVLILRGEGDKRIGLLNRFILMCFSIIILLFIITRPNIYDGWRHFYFLFAFIMLFAASGFSKLLEIIRSQRFKPRFWPIALVLAVAFVMPALSAFRLFPYGNVYFNLFAGPNPSKYFETDYWSLSYLDAWKFIERKTVGETNIVVSGNGPLAQSLEMMPAGFRRKVVLTDTTAEGSYDYLLWEERARAKAPNGSSPTLTISRAGIALSNLYTGEVRHAGK